MIWKLTLLASLAVSITTLYKVHKLMSGMSRVETEVTELESVVDGAVLLLNALAGEIRDNIGSDSALNDLADRIDDKAQALAEAIAANTPADEEVPNEEDDIPEPPEEGEETEEEPEAPDEELPADDGTETTVP